MGFNPFEQIGKTAAGAGAFLQEQGANVAHAVSDGAGQAAKAANDAGAFLAEQGNNVAHAVGDGAEQAAKAVTSGANQVAEAAAKGADAAVKIAGAGAGQFGNAAEMLVTKWSMSCRKTLLQRCSKVSAMRLKRQTIWRLRLRSRFSAHCSKKR